MNINEVINNIVKQCLNEMYFNNSFSKKDKESVPQDTEQLLYQYINSFPRKLHEKNFIIPYVNLNDNQKYILAKIAEKNSDNLQNVVDGIYKSKIRKLATKDIDQTPDDFLGEFLTSDTRENVYKIKGDETSNGQFGMALVVGDYLNNNKNNINYSHFIRHLCNALGNAYITCIESQLNNRLDSPLNTNNISDDTGFTTHERNTQIKPGEVYYTYDRMKGEYVEHKCTEPINVPKNNMYFYRSGYGGEKQSGVSTPRTIKHDQNAQNQIFNNTIIDISEIINDNSIGLYPQEKAVLLALSDISKTPLSNESLEKLLNLSDKQQVIQIYQEIADRVNNENFLDSINVSLEKPIPPNRIPTLVSKAIIKARNSKYANNGVTYNKNPEQVSVNNVTPEVKPTTKQEEPTTYPEKTTKEINPKNRVIKTKKPDKNQEFLKHNPGYNGWNVNISESNNKNCNKQNMKQRMRLTESTLRKLIIRAINESLTEYGENLTQQQILENWAEAVRDGKNPIYCKEFNNFFNLLIENPICEGAVKMGFADESKSQGSTSEFIQYEAGDEIPNQTTFYVLTDVNGKEKYSRYINNSGESIVVNDGDKFFFKETNPSNTPSLKIDKLFAVRPKIASDVISEFFTGVNYTAKEDSLKDSFLGDVAIKNSKKEVVSVITFYEQCVDLILNNKFSDFFANLSRRLRVYGAHYCRKHYNEFVTQWAIGSKTIGGELEDDEGNKIEAFDWQGEGDNKNKIDVAAELSKDPYTGMDKESSVTDIDKEDTQSGDSDYYRKLIRQVRKILKDPVIQLRPQEKAVLRALIKVSSTRYSQDRVNAMADMSDTQRTQQIYKEIADMLPDIAPDRIPRLISLAINKAKKSEYAKIDERKQKMVKLIVNEVIKRVLNEYSAEFADKAAKAAYDKAWRGKGSTVNQDTIKREKQQQKFEKYADEKRRQVK